MTLNNLRHREFIIDGPACIFDERYAVSVNRLKQTEFKIDKTISLIIERIALKFPHENPSLFTGFNKNQISRGDNERNEIIHQTKRKKTFDDCEKYGLLKIISRYKHNTGHYTIGYDLTTQGILGWFDYLRKYGDIEDLKNVKMVITKSERLLPWISINWNNLKELVGEDTLAKILLLSSNIIVNTYPEDNPPFSSASAEIFIGRLRFSLNADIIDHKKTGTGKIKFSEKFNKELEKLFTFVFIYNIIQNFKNSKESNKNESKLTSLIKSDSKTFDIYSKFFGQIKSDMYEANKFIIQLGTQYHIWDKRKKKAREAIIILRKQIREWKASRRNSR